MHASAGKLDWDPRRVTSGGDGLRFLSCLNIAQKPEIAQHLGERQRGDCGLCLAGRFCFSSHPALARQGRAPPAPT